MLRYADYSFYAFVLIIVVTAICIQSILVFLNHVLYLVGLWTIALINCFSMRRLSSELLYVNNVLANKKFMTLYTCCFTALAITKLIETPVYLNMLVHIELQQDTIYRVQIAHAAFAGVAPLVFLFLHLMMLYMLVKFEQHFTPELKEKIANNLRQAFANGDQLEENLDLDDEDLEQNQLKESKRQMHRKQKVYEEMADKQLQEIITTMMSVSSVVEPEIEEAEEQYHTNSFAFLERPSIAMPRKDSENLFNQKFTVEVQRQLLTQSNESGDTKF